MLDFAKKFHFNHFVQVDDDFDLCDSFVEKIYNLSINNDNKFIRYIKTHDNGSRWNTTQWVDGGSMIPYSFLKRINFKIDSIPISRWQINKHLSSGVWQQITNKLVNWGYKTIHLEKSLVQHLGYKDSRMNPEIRKKNHIRAINFINEKK